MFSKIRSTRLWSAVAALVLLTGLAAAPANAAVGPGGAVIACRIAWNNPHNSSHVGGTVNASVQTTCTAPVASIKPFFEIVDLTNSRSWPAVNANTYGTATNYANAALPCKPGTYVGTGPVQVTFPAGFTPAYTTNDGDSNYVSISCNGASRVAQSELPPNAEVLDDGTVVVTVVATRS